MDCTHSTGKSFLLYIYDKSFLSLLDQMLMFFSYENLQKNSYQFSSPCLRGTKALNFTSGWVQYCAR